MKKVILYSLLFTLIQLPNSLKAQTDPPSLHWEKNINGVVAGDNHHIKSVKDASGNIYALSHSDFDFKVIKFNSSGVILNVYTYNNPYNQDDTPYDIVVDASENVYVCGESFINYQYMNTLVKFNASGSIAWSQNLNGGTWIYPTDVTARAMALDNSNNILYTGNMNDSLTIGKISPSGSVLFTKTIFIDGIGIGAGMDMVTDASGAFFVAASVKNSLGDKDAVLFKTDANGNFVWRKKYPGLAGGDDEATYIGIDNSSNLYVAGSVYDVSTTNATATLVKLNASGAEQWIKSLFIGGQINAMPTALYVDAIGQTYLANNIKTSATQSYTRLYKHNSVGIQDFGVTLDDATMNENITSSIDLDISSNVYVAGFDTFSNKIFYSKYNSTGAVIYYLNYLGGSAFNNQPAAIFVDNSSSPNVVTSLGSNLYNIRFNAGGAFQYENIYSGTGNQFDEGVRVITQGNQSVYSLGTLSNGASQRDILLGKYNSQGNILWQNVIDYSGSDNEAYDFGNDAVYNIYTLGSGLISTYHSKYDSIGSPLWVNNYPGSYKKIFVDNIGNSYMAGDNFGGTKFSVQKINTAGSTIYSNAPTNSSDTAFYVSTVDVDASNRLYVGGTRTAEEFSPTPNHHCVAQKFGSAGNLLWTHVVNHCDSISSSSAYYTKMIKILVDASNDVYLLGNSYGVLPGDPSFVFVIKLDNSGNQIWRQDLNGLGAVNETTGDMKFSTIGTLLVYTAGNGQHIVRRLDKTDGSIDDEDMFGVNVTEARKIDEDNLNNIYVAGNSFTLETLRDYAIAKFDASGNNIWSQQYSNNYVGSDEVADLKVTASFRIFVTGRSFSTPGINPDFNLIKLCDIAKPVITSSSPLVNVCPGNSVTLYTSGNSYQWSDGSIADSLQVSTAGNYFCTVSKSDGCSKNTDTLSVTIKAAPITPEICLVTVDDSSTHNIIYWDKTGYLDVDHFIIYREDFTSSYTAIASVPYDSLSEYHDYAINPNVTTKRYKISAVDSCGTESTLSQYHNTLYCTDLGSGQFFWNLYEIESSANPVVNYIIMRQDTVGGLWHELDSTAGTQQTLNDPTWASFPDASWRVKTLWGISCTSTRAGVSTSRSNVRSHGLIATQAADIFANGGGVSVFPNPATNSVTVNFLDLGTTPTIITLKDASGRLIEQQVPTTTTCTFNMHELERGFYFVEVITSQGKIAKQVIKN